MNDQEQTTPRQDEPTCGVEGAPHKRCRSKVGTVVFFGLAFTLLVFSIGIFTGAGQSFAAMAHHGFGHGFCALGSDNGDGAKKMVNHILDTVNATDEQKTKAVSIVAAHTKSFKERYNSFKGLRNETMKLLTAETIDRAALEKLRQEKVKSIDAASQDMVTILADIADILTPKQRQELAAWHTECHKKQICEWNKKS